MDEIEKYYMPLINDETSNFDIDLCNHRTYFIHDYGQSILSASFNSIFIHYKQVQCITDHLSTSYPTFIYISVNVKS